MKIIVMFVLLFSFSYSNEALTHSSHKHEKVEATEDVAISKARKSVKILVGEEKLENSWNDAKLLSAEKKQIKGKTEWLVKFENIEVSDSKKKVLYVFLNKYGQYLAANFTGK
ncbi:MAG: DUF6488 family protein [Bacteriovoracaceae bacterium]